MRIDRVLAPNPGPFTGPGTNTWVVGDDVEVVVLDPGPVEASHERSILDVVGDRSVTAVVVTHTHPDHAPLANPLARVLSVPALGHAPGPEFEPDDRLRDGDVVRVGGHALEVVHTPGHSDDHCCFRAGDVLFTGDHIKGGSSVMVDDMTAYLRSLERVADLSLRRLLPGHGEEIDRPSEVISWYLAHRRERERQIVAAVRDGAATIGAVVEQVYEDVDRALHPLAARSVAAHLRKLDAEGVVSLSGSGWDSRVEVNG